MHLIAVNGFKRSGKGETANAVARLCAEDIVIQIGFADKLKRLTALTLGVPGAPQDHIAWADEFKVGPGVAFIDERFVGEAQPPKHMLGREVSGRVYFQNLGNEARGLFGDDFWVDQVLPNPARFEGPEWYQEARDTLAAMYSPAEYTVITDLRYPNEAERVLGLGGEVWEVVRPGTESDGHASEQPLPREMVTRQLVNDGTLEDLEFKVRNALGRMVASC